MSEGYGYYRIDFYKKDGTPDELKAKEAFDWCSKQYDWFTEEEPFTLENNQILWNERKYSDGLPLKSTFYKVPNLDGYRELAIMRWFKEMGDGVNAEAIAGSFTCDYTESDPEAYYRLCIIYKNGTNDFWNMIKLNRDICASYQWGMYYVVHPNTYNLLRGVFRNKKTGRSFLSGFIVLAPDAEDSDEKFFCKFTRDQHGHIDDSEPFLCDAEGNYIPDGNGIAKFNHFSETDFDIIEYFISDKVNKKPEIYGDIADWEFKGFSCLPPVFDLVKRKN